MVASPEEFWKKTAVERRERETLASQESQNQAIIELLDREAIAEGKAKEAAWKRLERVGRLIRIAAFAFMVIGNGYLIFCGKRDQ
ncbi:MAG: hypothetical protein IPK83_05475 [Planctomycetes bacterium]|nr:hypothetical protein [Planctomycetota bacterium]